MIGAALHTVWRFRITILGLFAARRVLGRFEISTRFVIQRRPCLRDRFRRCVLFRIVIGSGCSRVYSISVTFHIGISRFAVAVNVREFRYLAEPAMLEF